MRILAVLAENGRSATIRSFSVILLTMALAGGSAFAQDILTLTSGRELKVTIVEEGTDLVKYRDYENPAGPLYSVSKDKVAGIKYKKGSKPPQATVPVVIAEKEPVTASASPLLTTKKRNVLLDGKVQSRRNVKTIMVDNPEAIREYETGKKMCNLSNGCAVGVIITSFIASQAANGKETDSESKAAATKGLVVDGVFVIGAIVLASVGKSKIRHSVALYNSSLEKPVTYKLDLGLQEHGIGFAVKF
jgi:hypothetical protein